VRRDVVLTAGLTAMAAALAGVAVAVAGLMGVAAILGLLTFALAARVDPKLLAVTGLLVILMSRTVEIASGWHPTTYIDETVTFYLVVVLVGRRLLQRRRLHRPPGAWLFAGFMAMGALSSIVSDVPLTIAVSGALLVVKGVLLYVALAQVDWSIDDIGWLTRTAVWVLIVSLACALVNLALPAAWSAVFANTGHPQYRSFLPSLIGPFTHPLQFGNFVSLTAIACAVPLMFAVRGRAKSARWLFVASVLAAVLSFRRTAIVGLLAGVSFLALRRRHAGVLLSALLFLPIAGIALAPLVQKVATVTYDTFIVAGQDNARTRMTVDSITLAFQHFPLGVGFGRFGSAIAREVYSPEYVRLGYDSVYGLGSPGNTHNHGRFLTDTQWPAIFGETGVLGTICFVAGLIAMAVMFRRASHAGHVPLRLFGLVGLGWMVHILLESVAYPVFVTAPTSPMLFGLAAITSVMLSTVGPGPDADGIPAEPQVAAARPELPAARANTKRHRNAEPHPGPWDVPHS
jgi:hypothetical protein